MNICKKKQKQEEIANRVSSAQCTITNSTMYVNSILITKIYFVFYLLVKTDESMMEMRRKTENSGITRIDKLIYTRKSETEDCIYCFVLQRISSMYFISQN